MKDEIGRSILLRYGVEERGAQIQEDLFLFIKGLFIADGRLRRLKFDLDIYISRDISEHLAPMGR